MDDDKSQPKTRHHPPLTLPFLALESRHNIATLGRVVRFCCTLTGTSCLASRPALLPLVPPKPGSNLPAFHPADSRTTASPASFDFKPQHAPLRLFLPITLHLVCLHLPHTGPAPEHYPSVGHRNGDILFPFPRELQSNRPTPPASGIRLLAVSRLLPGREPIRIRQYLSACAPASWPTRAPRTGLGSRTQLSAS